jgi:hypothetical protein
MFFMLIASVVKPQSKPITTLYTDLKDIVEVPPEYIGGMETFTRFIEDEFHPPDTFSSSEKEDKLLASFVIEKDGSLTNIVIVKDLGYGTGDELMRVLKLSKKWKPGMQDGRPVKGCLYSSGTTASSKNFNFNVRTNTY